jgi:hypothetical protein
MRSRRELTESTARGAAQTQGGNDDKPDDILRFWFPSGLDADEDRELHCSDEYRRKHPKNPNAAFRCFLVPQQKKGR